MAILPVKWYSYNMPGAPVLDHNWGSLISVLDACLVNGFNLVTLDSLTQSGGVATATRAAGHNFIVNQVIEISGADQTEYNGQFVVTSVTSTTFTFNVTGNPVSPATSGTGITAKVAPLGWEKPFGDTTLGIYRSLNTLSPRKFLRVYDGTKGSGYDDTSWARWANVGMADNIVGIGLSDIQGDQVPYDPADPNKNWTQTNYQYGGWFKWYHARTYGSENYGYGGAGARQWVIIGDDRLFFILSNWALPGQWNYSTRHRYTYCFGDIISFRPSDQYNVILLASDNRDGNVHYDAITDNITGSLQFNGFAIFKNYTQTGNSVRCGVTSLNVNNSQPISGLGPIPLPNGPDFGFLLFPFYIREENPAHLRGMLPGVFFIPQISSSTYSDLTIIENIAGLPGRKCLLVNTNYNYGSVAQLAFDITGPWR